jgi:hypothetical protein
MARSPERNDAKPQKNAWSHCSTRRGNNGVSAPVKPRQAIPASIHAGQSGFKGSGFLLKQWFDFFAETMV